MKKNYITIMFLLAFVPHLNAHATLKSSEKLKRYRSHLIEGTYTQQNWESFLKKPKSRYETFLKAFEHFESTHGKVIVELGTTRSFVHGARPGCNSDDVSYWMPNNPEHWDWSAGCFTRMAAECLDHLKPEIHTIDSEGAAITRCKIMTAEYSHSIKYHVTTSESFLSRCNFPQGIDLIYLDTGYMNPIEPTARLQLKEAQIIVERNLLAPNGLILIDDVRNQNVIGNDSGLGKSKYALPYLLENGFEIIEDEYQIMLKRKKN